MRNILVLAAVLSVQCGGTTEFSTGASDASLGSGGAKGTGGIAASGGSGGVRVDASAGATGTGGEWAAGGWFASGGHGDGSSPGSGGNPGDGGSLGSGGAPDAGACSQACGTYRTCCDGRCANTENDILNCGQCRKTCTGQTPYCNGGTCTAAPCESGHVCIGTTTCCGTGCCAVGTICCDPQGPVSSGPTCVTPVDGTCPVGCAPLCVCASPDTPIATPFGDRAISSLGIGDLVYSVDHGQIAVVPVARTNRIAARNHFVRRIVLATGAVLEISAPHPTADGRLFGDLRAGDSLDGVEIAEAATVAYRHDFTYDILPDSDTGAYYAGGALIGSTLLPGEPAPQCKAER